MSVKQAITEKRDVNIVITGAPMPIDAYKAVIERVAVLEGAYHKNPTAAVDLAAASSVFTGTILFQLYAFDITTDYAAGTYTFAFVEVRPNIDDEI